MARAYTATCRILPRYHEIEPWPVRPRGQRLARLLPIGRVKLAQIARDTLLQLSTPPFACRGAGVTLLRRILAAVAFQ
jgi:hypothetical protein